MKPRRHTEQHDVSRNEEQDYNGDNPTVPVKLVAGHRLSRNVGQDVLKATDSNGALFHCAEAGFVEQRHDFARIHMTVTMKVCQHS